MDQDKTSKGGTESAAWTPFESRLAEALGAMEEDQSLIISAKRGRAFVQFAAQGSFGLRAESVSNNYLPESHTLSTDQIAALQKLGWSAPTGTPQEATPERQPDGSPNFFCDFARPVPFADVARLAVRTLTEVLGFSHPGFLEYQAFDANHNSILLPTLGLMNRPKAPQPAEREAPMSKTHYGDEDPDFTDATDPESEQELFEAAKHMGWNPDDMRNKVFAAKYREWLKTAPPKERDADGD